MYADVFPARITFFSWPVVSEYSNCENPVSVSVSDVCMKIATGYHFSYVIYEQ